MSYDDERLLCESIVNQFKTVGLGLQLNSNETALISPPTLAPPFQSSIRHIVKTRVFSPGGGTGNNWPDFTNAFQGPNIGGTDAWVDMPSRCRQPRPMAEPFTGQGPPYDPTWVTRWVPMESHQPKHRTVRTIESFVGPGALFGDGVAGGGQQEPNGHDDTTQMNNAIAAALRFAHNNANTHLVVSFTRTYICDNSLFLDPDRVAVGIPIPNGLQNPHATSSIEFTGPGGITRHYKNSSGALKVYDHGPDRLNASVYVSTDRTKFTSIRIDSNRRRADDGGRNNDFEAQHAFWFLSALDCELRNVYCSNYMGDGIAVAGNASKGSEGIRVYNSKFINGGRHCITPLGSNLDFYNNYFERNTSHLSDLETSGSGAMYNAIYRNNRFTGCHGDGMRTPAYATVGLTQCSSHGTKLRGCAWVENVRDSKSGAPFRGPLSLFVGSLDLGWEINQPTRNVTQGSTTLHGLTLTSPNFNLHVPDATWQGEERAAISGSGIPVGSYIGDVVNATTCTISNTSRRRSRFATDVLVSGSPNVYSPSTGFDSSHIGMTIVGDSRIPANTTIIALGPTMDGHHAIMSANATGSTSGALVTVLPGCTATASNVTFTVQCIAGPYGTPTNVGADHASLGEHESADFWFVRNMWTEGSAQGTWGFGSDTPQGYQGIGHAGGPNGWNRVLLQYNQGPTNSGSVGGGIGFLNVSNQAGALLTETAVIAANPGLFEQPGS